MGEVMHTLYLFAALQSSSDYICILCGQIKAFAIANFTSSTLLIAKYSTER